MSAGLLINCRAILLISSKILIGEQLSQRKLKSLNQVIIFVVNKGCLNIDGDGSMASEPRGHEGCCYYNLSASAVKEKG